MPLGRAAGRGDRKTWGLGPCLEVLIPGTRRCAGAEPRDEVMKDSTVTPGAGVPADDVIAGREGSLSAWKTQPRSYLLLDKPWTPGCSTREGSLGTLPCCCAL